MKKIKHQCMLCKITTTDWNKHQDTKRHQKEISKLAEKPPYYLSMEFLNALRMGKYTPLRQLIPRRKMKDLDYNWRLEK